MQLDEYIKLARQLVEQQYGKPEPTEKEQHKLIDCGEMDDQELRQCLLTYPRPRRLQIGKFEIKLEWYGDKVHAEIYEIKNKVHCSIQVYKDSRIKDQPWAKQWNPNKLEDIIKLMGHLQCVVFLPLFL